MELNENATKVGRVGLPELRSGKFVKISNELGGYVAASNSVLFAGDPVQKNYLYLDDSAELRLRSSPGFTVAFWVQGPTHSGRGVSRNAILNKEASWEIGFDFSSDPTLPKLAVALQADGGSWEWLTSPIVVKPGEWAHVAWTWDGTYHRLFKNGLLGWTHDNGSGGTGAPEAHTSPFTIGGRGTSASGIASTKISFGLAELKIFDGWVAPSSGKGAAELGFGAFMGEAASQRPELKYYFPLRGIGDYVNHAVSGPAVSLKMGYPTGHTSDKRDRLVSGGPVVIGRDAGLGRWSLHPGEGPAGQPAVGYWMNWHSGFSTQRANWLKNPSITEVDLFLEGGWDRALNGGLGTVDWGGYNSGIADPNKGFHAHLLAGDGVFGGNSVEMADENSYFGHPQRWLGMFQDVTDAIGNIAGNGEKITVSFYVKAYNPDAHVAFGLYHYNPHAGGNSFETASGQGLYTSDPIGVVGEWVRIEHTWDIDTAYYDTSSTSKLYIYGNHNGQDSRILVSAPQLENTTCLVGATGYTPAIRSISEYAELPPGVLKQISTDEDFLFSAWLKRVRYSDKSKRADVLYLEDSSAATPPFPLIHIYQQNDTVHAHVVDDGQHEVNLASANGVMNDEQWHHVALHLKRNATGHDEVRLYVDGAVVDSDLATLNPQGLDVGGFAGDAHYIGSSVAGGVNGSCNSAILNGLMFNTYIQSPDSDPGPALQQEYNLIRALESNDFAYWGDTTDGARASLISRPSDAGVMRVLADRGWTVFDPASAQLWGKYGRGWAKLFGLIEELPYGPSGTSLWVGAGSSSSANWLTRWGIGSLHTWHSGINAADYEFAERHGPWFRTYKYNLNDGERHTEALTGDLTARCKAGQRATMRMLVRSDSGYVPSHFSFFNQDGHHSEPTYSTRLRGNVYFVYASHYFDSCPGDGRMRAVDIPLEDQPYEWLDIAHPALFNAPGNGGPYLYPFAWGKSTLANTGTFGAESPVTAYIKFAQASQIMGQNRTGTIIMSFNPMAHQPEDHANLFSIGNYGSSNDFFYLRYGDAAASDNRLTLHAHNGGTDVVTFDFSLNHTFSPWSWYYVAVTWGAGQVTLGVYDEGGHLLASQSATYTDADFPDFTHYSSGGSDMIRLFGPGEYIASLNAAVGPAAFHQNKLSGIDDAVATLARGRLAVLGRSSYLARPLTTMG